MIHERFGLEVKFGTGQIVYKETIAAPVEGVGHFEPLRHYAEVHLLMEPLEAGSGLVFDTVCSENMLDRNWQRLILTHLEEKVHRGVLMGAPITDMRITLIAGRARSEAYRRRGFQAGDLPSGAPGTAESRKCTAGTLLPLQAGIAAASGRTCHDRY